LLNGQIDHCWGRYLFGWSIPREPNKRCLIAVVDPLGRVIADTRADLPRPDLVTVGGGECDFAFQLGIPFTDTTGPFRILADGVEIPGSPLFMEPDIIAGALSIQSGRVSGWVANRYSVTETQPVDLIDQDGRLVLTVLPAVAAADEDPLFRPGRFDVPLPDACFGRAELCLTARIRNRVVAQAMGSARLEGYLDAMTSGGCAGWLFSPDAPERQFRVVAYRDGRSVGQTLARLPRPDVGSRFAGARACGFELSFTTDTKPCQSLSHISLRLAASDRELLGGPYLIGSQAAAIEQALDSIAMAPGGPASRAIWQDSFAQWLRTTRSGPELRLKAQSLPPAAGPAWRMSIVVPVYADGPAIRACLDSVLRYRSPATDALVIVNDNPADPEVGAIVDRYAGEPNVFVLRNTVNLGFVGAANRGMAFMQTGDVLLLNADTEVFQGGIDELHRVLHADERTGSVTALSNNATLFSYPHPAVIADALDDIDWPDLAAIALRENAAQTVSIPTGHGFCMLIRRAVIEDIGLFDNAFGRGYGEENDFSLRAAERGWIHVAAGGVFVRHAEARSFGAEKATLVARNLELLLQRYPEYGARIDWFAEADPVRRLRWPLDSARMRAAAAHRRLWLVVDNWLDGGTRRATADIANAVQPAEAIVLKVTGQRNGHITVTMDGLALRTVFAAEEGEELFGLLATLPVERVVVHHLLGFSRPFLTALRRYLDEKSSIFHIHDFYYGCPRVTMIDATGGFCGGLESDHCDRCIALGGAHEAHRLTATPVAAHRRLFTDLLTNATHVIAPSQDAADRLAGLLPNTQPVAVPHPQTKTTFPIGARRGSLTDICLLGAIGPHKGSKLLLTLARYAALNHPAFHFHVVGFTDIDDDLLAVGNVSISGSYEPEDLPRLVEKTRSRIALFLHAWPETFSYTLTEAVSLGLIPVVPDIGAPADRVRAAGFGAIFPFPADSATVMDTLIGVAKGAISFSRKGGLPLGFDTSSAHQHMRRIYADVENRSDTPPPKAGRRKAVIR